MVRVKSKLLLTPKMFKPSFKEWRVDGVLNPAAVRLPNKDILLYVRVAESSRKSKAGANVCPVIVSKDHYETIDEKVRGGKIDAKNRNILYLKSGICRLRNISHFRRVILDKSGFKVKSIDQVPEFTGVPEADEYGVEDARITKIDKLWYMTYVSVSKKNGVSTSLAVSKDLKSWERKGIIFSEQNKDAVIFPEKINGMYVAFNRPETMFEFSRPGIWISYSPDLVYWGREQSVIKPREGSSWESDRIGSGPPPIKTEKGWLLIYHGVHTEDDKNTYSVGALLLDLKNPEKILARTPLNKPLIIPTAKYEKKGYINNVIFPTGLVPDLDGKHLILFSGGADSITTVKRIAIKDVFKSLEVA